MPQGIHEFQLSSRQAGEVVREGGTRLAKASVPLHALGDAKLVTGGHMHLPRTSSLRCSQELRLVKLTLGTTARGLSADASPRTESSANQRPPLVENELELTAHLLRGFE
jgi:hypothetical protein